MPRLSEFIEEDAQRATRAIQSSTAAEQAARQAREMIVSRTLRGISRQGRRFKSYAQATAERKGRFQPVTLRESGQMFRSLTIRDLGPQDAQAAPSGRGSQLRGASGQFVSRADVRFGATVNIKGSRNRRIARYHIKGTKDMPQRDFMGLTSSQEAEVKRTLDRGLERDIRRAIPEDRRRRVELKLFG